MLNERQRAAKDAASAYFLGLSASAAVSGGSAAPDLRNVIGWGIGNLNSADGSPLSGAAAVHVYVREVLPNQHIPEHFKGVPTDVIEVSQITTCQHVETGQRSHRLRPTPCGVSVGHRDVTAGTLGCLVEKSGNHYILSNNHVLAASNAASSGDAVVQPGPADGGTLQDQIATLEPYQEIDFSGDAEKGNRFDAAIALVGNSNQTLVMPKIIDIGLPRPYPQPAALGQTVRKHGLTTGHTLGVVKTLDVKLQVEYEVGDRKLFAWFDEQIAIEGAGNAAFSAKGDSGALIVNQATLEPVGLLFAVSHREQTKRTFANPIHPVLEHYRVTVVGEKEETHENDC